MRLLAQIRRLWMLDAFRPDIPLSRDEASRFLPWIIALMVYLAALTLAGGFTLHRTIAASHSAQLESFSVHMPTPADNADATTQKALALIKDTPGVSDAALLSSAELKQMVEPWLGKSAALGNLQLPLIIDVKVTPGANVDYAQLKSKLSLIAPGADIDDHKKWMDQFSNFVRMVQWVLFVISLFIIMATATVVIFACKTSLKIHRTTVNLLHRLGALDSYIAGQFQHHAALLALKGAFVGSGFASGTLLALHLMALHLDSPLFPSFSLTLSHGLILLSLPLLMSLLALISARLSVLSALGRMP